MNKRELLKKVYNYKNNIIVSGRINSRKTYGVMFPLVEILMENNESFLVLDSKEEYIRRFYNELKEKGYDTVVINLRDSLRSDGWNPLTYAYSLYSNNHVDEAIRSIEKIAYVLFNDTADPYWATSAKNLFLGIVWFLFENADEEEINLKSVVELLDVFADKEYLFVNLENGECRSAELLNPIIKAPLDTKNSIVSIVRQTLAIYTNYPNLTKMLSTPMKELHLDHKFAIFFINRDEDLYFNALASVFIDQFYDFLMKKKYDTSFNFVLDNYETIANDYPNINILLSSGPFRKVRTIIGSNETIDYYDSYSENITSTEENVIFNLKGEEEIVPNDYERVDFNQVINYPILETSDVKTFNVCPCCSSSKTCTCEDKCDCNKDDFSKFIQNKEFEDIARDISFKELTRKIDEEIKKLNLELHDNIPDDEDEISKIIRKIDDEIAYLEKTNSENTNDITNVRSQFANFLDENKFDDIKDDINRVDNTHNDVDFNDDELNKIIKNIDDEIKRLDVELNDDIPDDEDEIQELVNRIEAEIARLEEEDNNQEVKQVRNNFKEFLDRNDFEEIAEEVKEIKYYDFDELIESINREIERLENEGKETTEKNDFEKFLEGNTFETLVEDIKNRETEDSVTYEQLIEALDKEIALLEEKVNNDNREDFNEIIKKIDEEIARLEREDDINPTISETRENYDELIEKIDQEIARLESEEAKDTAKDLESSRNDLNPFSDVSDIDAATASIDKEIARLEREQEEINRNKFDFNEIDRLNKEIDEELAKLPQDDEGSSTSHVIEIE